MRLALWQWFLMCGVLAVGVYFVLSGPAAAICYDLLSTSSCVAVMVGIRRNRPAYRLPWLLLAVGLALQAAGDVTWDAYVYVLGREAPYPSLADAFYLTGLVLAPIAFLLLSRRRTSGRSRGDGIDAAIVAAGVAALAWTFWVDPTVLERGVGLGARVLALAYPTVDIFAIAVLAAMLFQPGERPFALKLFAAGFGLVIVADVVYARIAITGDTYGVGNPIDAGWLLWNVLWGTAALHPSMRRLGEPLSPPPEAEAGLTRRRLALLSTATLLAPSMFLVQWLRHQELDVPVLALTSALLFLLVIWRLRLVVQSLAGSLAARDALQEELLHAAYHDPVTGLPNRTFFLQQLGEALEQRRQGGDVGVLFVDLDDFKLVNDRLGHAIGDQLLGVVGQRIDAGVRDSDLTARIGGDEFTILLSDEIDLTTAQSIADRVLARVQAPIVMAGELISPSASIGIALASEVGADMEALLRSADRAMYHAKQLGKGRWAVAGEHADEAAAQWPNRPLSAAG